MKKELNIVKKSRSSLKSYLTLKQRITAGVMTAVMLLQICMPAVAAAAIAWSDPVEFSNQLQTRLQSPLFTPALPTSDYAYQNAFYMDYDAPDPQADTSRVLSIENFFHNYRPTDTASVVKSVGETFVQTRLIRSQIKALLGRFLIPANISSARFEVQEADQINQLYSNGLAYGRAHNNLAFGSILPATASISADMIWPEIRTIATASGPQSLVVPVVYITDATKQTGVFGNQIIFASDASIGALLLNGVQMLTGRQSIIDVTTGVSLINNASIQGMGNLKLSTSGTLANLGTSISAQGNLDLIANNVISKTLVIPYKDQNGQGTHLGSVSSISSGGSMTITADTDITFIGATASSGGTMTFNAVTNNLSILPVSTGSQSYTDADGWRVNQSTLDLLQSKLTAEDTITLMAGGSINITASEIISTRGGIELLAKQGIYILDDQGNTQVSREKYKGRTKGTSSDFNTWAVRSILNAGKGVLMDTDAGDIVLRAAQITSVNGTSVYARNGKVHLLITKEQSQHYLNMVRKGTWTVKTRTEQDIVETPVPNAIVGGFAVEALQGVDVEYGGKPGATLAEQIAEYKNMPNMKWMSDLYNNGQVNGNVDWSQIELVSKHIRESHTSLSPAAMAIIAICVAVAMGPAGANLIGSGGIGAGTVTSTVGGITTTTTSISLAGAVAQAGMLTLATSAAQNLAAGHNLEDTLNAMTSDDALRSLAISMATAGAMNALDIGNMELFKDVNPNTTSLASLGNQAYQAVVSATVTAGISVTINGGNSSDYRKAFTQSLAVNVINTIGQNLSDKIGGSKTLDEAGKYITQAALGCLTSGLTNKLSDSDFKDACVSGAGGAVIAQGASDFLDKYVKDTYNELSNDPSKIGSKNISDRLNYLGSNGVDLARLMAAFAAFALGGDVNAAANGASMVAQSNRNNMLKAVTLGNLMVDLGMVGCGNSSFSDCQITRLKDLVRGSLKADGKYTSQQIEAALNTLDAKSFFDTFRKFNTAFFNDGATVEDMAANIYAQQNTNDSSSPSTGSSSGIQEVVVNGTRMTMYQEALFKFGNVTGSVVETGENAVGSVINAALNTPIGQPIKLGLSWMASKGKDLAKEHEVIQETADKLDEISKLYGTGSLAYLYDQGYQKTKDDVASPNYQDESLFVKGISWIGNTVTGFTTAKAVSASFKYIKAGEKSFRDVIPSHILTSRTELKNFIKNNNIPLKAGWDADRLYDDVLSKVPPNRPMPDTYLPPEYIASQLGKFDSGVVRVTKREYVDAGGLLAQEGVDSYVFPLSDWSRINQLANGDPRKMEDLLGLNRNYFKDRSDVYVAQLNPADIKPIKFPTGNESGANPLWVPGLMTSGGISEGVTQISVSALSHSTPLVF